MGRGWRLGVAGVVVVGALAMGGYWYVDHELRTGAEVGLREVNALYKEWGFPPLTYERLETDVLARTVTVHHLRQAGLVTGPDGLSGLPGQTVETTLDRVDVVSHMGGTLDIAYRGLRTESHVPTGPSGRPPGPVDSVVTVDAGGMTGLRGDTWRKKAVRELFGWYDRAFGEGLAIQVAMPPRVPGGTPQTVHMEIAQVAMRSDAGGGGEASLTGMTMASMAMDGPEGVTGRLGSSSIRFRPTDAIGRLVDLLPRMRAGGKPSPEDMAALQGALADYGRSIAGVSVSDVDIAVAGEKQRFSLGEAAIDNLTWQGPILTDLEFHIDDMDVGMPDRLTTDQRAVLESLGLTAIDQSMRVGVRYDPDMGSLRVAPFATSTRDMLAVSVEAGLDNFHLPDTFLQEGFPESPAGRRQAKRLIKAALLSSVPTPVSARIEDRGGLGPIMAFMAGRQGLSAEELAGKWADTLERQGERMIGRENAVPLARNVQSFLTGKRALTVEMRLRQPVALGAMAGLDVARILEISSSVE